MKRMSGQIIHMKHMKVHKKLKHLKLEKLHGPQQFQVNDGSRKITSVRYVKNVKDAIPGAPFPTNLRMHRRGRPHHNFGNPKPQGYTVTEEELSKRDPVILFAKEDFSISQAAKELMRLGPKFCPTPRGPVDELGQYQSWLSWRESVRWNWFHNNGKELDEIENNYVKKPWDTKTDRAAPIATDCPVLEALFEGCRRDLFDPTQRKQIKDNLSTEQRNYIKEVKTIYPTLGIRIRSEDKGHRFVVADAETEDNLIENHLKNEEQFVETDEDKTEEHIAKIKEWADRGLKQELNIRLRNTLQRLRNGLIEG